MTRRLLAPLALTMLIAGCGSGTDTATPTSPSTTVTSPVTGPSPSPSPGSPSPSPSPAPAGCSASVSGIPASVGSQNGRYPFAITSNCPWTARTDAGWADVAPGSGDGTATPTLNVSENATAFTRTVTVTINGQSFQATQRVANCTYTLDRTTLDENFDGGLTMVLLTTSDSCSWTASASESWIRVVTPSGTGTTKVYFDLAANGGDVRHAYLTIAGQRVEVTQRRRG